MRGFAALLACAVLGGCASVSAPSSDSWTTWLCDTDAELYWHYTDTAKEHVDVRLKGSEQVYHLKAEPGAAGELYSDGVLAFHVMGNGGLVYWVATNDLIGRGCKAP
ncbi:MAG: MliC family protein [Pseudomonas sp.]|uniref:MliC family protein n=1 Tax=Pseudomonas abieticivorans TaxID=2931382 RepID=UPI0020BDBB40|nr:MliC family protein [Pseudomonas sp. PIA16]MDE1167083.1 MliC family protein [Pseudomonas sp.]